MYSRISEEATLKLSGFEYESVNVDESTGKGNFAYNWFKPATKQEIYNETLESYNTTSIMCDAIEVEKGSVFCVYYSRNTSKYYAVIVRRLETGESVMGTRIALSLNTAKIEGTHLLYKNKDKIEFWTQCTVETNSKPKYNKCVFAIDESAITLETKEENISFTGKPEHQITKNIGITFPYCSKKLMVVLNGITGENTSAEESMAVTSEDALETFNGTIKSCGYIGGNLYVTSDSGYIFRFVIDEEAMTITYADKLDTGLDYVSAKMNPLQLKKYGENKFFVMYGSKKASGTTENIIMQDYEVIENNPTLIATSTAPACGNTDQLIQPVRRTSEKEYDVAYSGFYGGEIVRVSIANDIPYFNIKPYNDYVRGMGAYLHQRQMLFLEDYDFTIYIKSSILYIVVQEKDESFCFSKQKPSGKCDICVTRKKSDYNQSIPVAVSDII